MKFTPCFEEQSNKIGFLKQLESYNIFSKIDLQWGKFVKDFFSLQENPDDLSLVMTSIFLSYLAGKNFICLDINYWENKNFPEDSSFVNFPSKEKWLKMLSKCCPPSLLTTVGSHEKQWDSNEPSLLIKDNQNRIYLQKYYYYQKVIANTLIKKSQRNLLNIISGGPGTGKTTMVFEKILEYLSNNPQGKILLLAPTGKAANRLKQSINQAKQNSSHSLAGSVTSDTKTIHRHLSESRYENRQWDLIIIDEASMISFPLFYELLLTMVEDTQLLLLGDKDQLSSVEEGSLFYEIIEIEKEECSEKSKTVYQLDKSIIHLSKNYRFKENSMINRLAIAIRKVGGKEEVRQSEINQIFEKLIPAHEVPVPIDGNEVIWFAEYNINDIKEIWKQKFLEHYKKWFSLTRNIPENKEELFSLFKERIFLCANRHGEYGLKKINQHIEKWIYEWLIAEELINLNNNLELYHGKPIIINKNNYHLGIYNGDIGIVSHQNNKRNNKIYEVYFEEYEQPIPIQAITEYEPVYAMTIHKSQGSEFDEVITLFNQVDKDFFSREIIYTALTRAKKTFCLFIQKEIFQATLNRDMVRRSGLSDLLMKKNNEN